MAKEYPVFEKERAAGAAQPQFSRAVDWPANLGDLSFRHSRESGNPVPFAGGAMLKSLGPGYRFATAFAGLQTRTPKAAHSASAMDGASNSGMTIKNRVSRD